MTALASFPDVSDLRHRVRRLTWFQGSFGREAAVLGERHGLRFSIDERALAAAFFGWVRAFDRERASSERNRRDFAVYAGGLMLQQLLSAGPVRAQAPQTTPVSIPPDPSATICAFWPEGYLYTSYCLTLVRAVHEQDFGGMDPPGASELDMRVWESFRENFKEQPYLAVPFFDVFMGVEPNWQVTGTFLERPAAKAAALRKLQAERSAARVAGGDIVGH